MWRIQGVRPRPVFRAVLTTVVHFSFFLLMLTQVQYKTLSTPVRGSGFGDSIDCAAFSTTAVEEKNTRLPIAAVQYQLSNPTPSRYPWVLLEQEVRHSSRDILSISCPGWYPKMYKYNGRGIYNLLTFYEYLVQLTRHYHRSKPSISWVVHTATAAVLCQVRSRVVSRRLLVVRHPEFKEIVHQIRRLDRSKRTRTYVPGTAGTAV